MGKYDFMIDLPHHRSTRHAPMSQADRAAQFAPFAALRGYDDTIRETARRTDAPVQLAEDEKERLDQVFREIRDGLAARPVVRLTYFSPDPVKPGGVYLEKTGAVRKIDALEKLLIFQDGDAICWETVRSAELIPPRPGDAAGGKLVTCPVCIPGHKLTR